MARTPPDILITTPESLYLLLTSAAREILVHVETVIVDEIHALAPSKRGAHLFLSLERLEAIRAPEAGALQRIGLSATQRPLDEVARLLGGFHRGKPRPVTIVDAGHKKAFDLTIEVPDVDMANLSRSPRPAGGAGGRGGGVAEGPNGLASEGDASPERTIGRTSTSASSPSSAPTARRSSSSTAAGSPSASRARSTRSQARRSRSRITARWRARSAPRSRSGSSKASYRRSSRRRPSSSGSTWGRSISSCRSSRLRRSRRGCSASAGRATASAASQRGCSCRSTAPISSRRPPPQRECAPVRWRRLRTRETRSTSSRSRSWPRSRARRLRRSMRSSISSRRAAPFAELPRSSFDGVLDMLSGRYPSGGLPRSPPADHVGPDARSHQPARRGAAPRGDERRNDP